MYLPVRKKRRFKNSNIFSVKNRTGTSKYTGLAKMSGDFSYGYKNICQCTINRYYESVVIQLTTKDRESCLKNSNFSFSLTD